jgi:hypothetical protein
MHGLTQLGRPRSARCWAAVVPMIKLDRRAAYRGDECLRDHPVQDALTGLVNLLIQTPESVRHPWTLG